jgi:hypothetical protein
MKRAFYFVLITVTLALFGTSSCKKDPNLTGGYISTGNNTGSYNNSTLLQANNWVKHVSGFYIHTFNGIISQGQSVKVYLLDDDGSEILINQAIHFKDGQLWARTQFTDLEIHYRSSGTLPFSSLNIRLVTE